MRSSLERGLPRADPPKGQAVARATVNLSGKADREGKRSRAWRHAVRRIRRTAFGVRLDQHPASPPAAHAAARPAPRTRGSHGAVRRLRDAGQLPGRHHRRAPPLPCLGRAVRCLAHGPVQTRRRDAAAALESLVPMDIVGSRHGPAALRPADQRIRRHPRRPDGQPARAGLWLRRPAAGRQRGLQARRPAAPGDAHRPPLHGSPTGRPRAARAAGSEGGRCTRAAESRRRRLDLHGRRRLPAAGQRLFRHPLRLHRRGRFRDLDSAGAGERTRARAARPARSPAGRPRRARHPAPGSRLVPVRSRHRPEHDADRGRARAGRSRRFAAAAAHAPAATLAPR